MRLKENAKLVEFLQCTKQCAGEVYFKSAEGDILNLKSQLSQYIFLAALVSENIRYLPEGEIECQYEADYALLSPYLIP